MCKLNGDTVYQSGQDLLALLKIYHMKHKNITVY